MNINLVVIVIHIIVMIVAVTLGFFSLTRMKSENREYFVLFLFCAAIYALGIIMETTASTADGGLLSAKFGYIGSMLYAPMLLVFIQKYCQKPLPKLVNFIIFLSAFAVIALVWTTEFHKLFYIDYWYDDISPVHHLANTRGILYPLGKIHPAICILISAVILVGNMRNASLQRKKRLLALMFCAIAPAAAQLTWLFRINIVGWNDFQSVLILAGIIIVYFGVAKYDLLENKEIIHIKRDFLQDMSHEMKNPLTVIAIGIDYADKQISGENGDVPKALAALEKIRNETQRLGRMVEGMVDLANMGGTAANRKRVDLAVLLKSGAEAFRPALERQNNTLRTEIAPGLPDVFVEEDKFAQVITNLLSNAAEHTRDGRISIAAEFDRAYITVRVSDTGSGIPEEILPHVFERGVSGKGGTGYGLYICKTIVEAHGGTIGIESGELIIENEVREKGTVVTFTVPVYGGQEVGHKM